MNKEFRYQGVWWLPNKPDNKVPGSLEFDPQTGATLELMGPLEEIQNKTKMLAIDIILGSTTDGKDITLSKCFQTESNIHHPGTTTSTFYIDMVLIGVHFKKNEDIKFNSISVQFTHLDEWAHFGSFETQYLPKDETIIKHKLPKSIKTAINDDWDLAITPSASHNYSNMEVSIKNTITIKIESKKEKALDEFYEKMNTIRNLLTLGTREQVYPLSIEGETELNKTSINGNPYYPPVKIFYKNENFPKKSKTLISQHMLFTFKDLSDRFEFFIKNWFERASLLKSIHNLYFGTIYNPRLYVEHQFLSFILALEAFHRQVYDGKYMSDEKYKKICKVLKNSIPKEVDESHRDSLKNRIKYGNEFSLRKRLTGICKTYEKNIDNFIKNKDTFIEDVISTRNYLIHNSPELKDKASGGKELISLTYKMKILLEICILAEMGFNPEEINSLFSRISSRILYEIR